eukprot:1189342-Prorocentrum_minimum.AAC.9
MGSWGPWGTLRPCGKRAAGKRTDPPRPLASTLATLFDTIRSAAIRTRVPGRVVPMITHGHRACATMASRLAQSRRWSSSRCANGRSSTSTSRGGALDDDPLGAIDDDDPLSPLGTPLAGVAIPLRGSLGGGGSGWRGGGEVEGQRGEVGGALEEVLEGVELGFVRHAGPAVVEVVGPGGGRGRHPLADGVAALRREEAHGGTLASAGGARQEEHAAPGGGRDAEPVRHRGHLLGLHRQPVGALGGVLLRPQCRRLRTDSCERRGRVDECCWLSVSSRERSVSLGCAPAGD